MGARFPEKASLARLIGPEAPVPLCRIFRLERHSRHSDAELGVDEAHLADGACGNHGARLAHHWVAGVAMGKAEETAGALDEFGERQRLVEIMGQWFLADDIDAAFKECLGDGKVK